MFIPIAVKMPVVAEFIFLVLVNAEVAPWLQNDALSYVLTYSQLKCFYFTITVSFKFEDNAYFVNLVDIVNILLVLSFLWLAYEQVSYVRLIVQSFLSDA